MKKMFAVMAGLLIVATTLTAQTPKLVGGSVGTDIYRISTWTPFSSDSLAWVYSDPLDVAAYDTLYFFVKATSVNGTPNFHVALQLGMLNSSTAANWDSTAVAVDTTNSQAEKFKYVAGKATYGAAFARLKLVGRNETGTANHKDDIVNLWIVGQRRGKIVIR